MQCTTQPNKQNRKPLLSRHDANLYPVNPERKAMKAKGNRSSLSQQHPRAVDLLRSVKLLVHKMEQEVHVKLQVALEQVHKLVSLELGLQHVLDAHHRACTRHLNVASGAFNGEHANLVT